MPLESNEGCCGSSSQHCSKSTFALPQKVHGCNAWQTKSRRSGGSLGTPNWAPSVMTRQFSLHISLQSSWCPCTNGQPQFEHCHSDSVNSRKAEELVERSRMVASHDTWGKRLPSQRQNDEHLCRCFMLTMCLRGPCDSSSQSRCVIKVHPQLSDGGAIEWVGRGRWQ